MKFANAQKPWIQTNIYFTELKIARYSWSNLFNKHFMLSPKSTDNVFLTDHFYID